MESELSDETLEQGRNASCDAFKFLSSIIIYTNISVPLDKIYLAT